MLLKSDVVCDPPLGQTTVVPAGQDNVTVTLLIEASKSFAERQWEARLWHNAENDDAWTELTLNATELDYHPIAARTVAATPDKPQLYRRYYTATLSKPSHRNTLRFTFKYRLGQENAWTWANEQLHTGDGLLCFQVHSLNHNIAQYLQNIPKHVSIQDLRSSNHDCKLWDLSFDIPSASSVQSKSTTTEIGEPVSYDRWYACVRKGTPWLEPRHGKATFDLKDQALLCSFLRFDGIHLVALALTGHDDALSLLESDKTGNIIAISSNYRNETNRAHVFVAAGKTYDLAASATIYHARSLISGETASNRKVQVELEKALANEATTKWMENWYDGLTYCTWNSLGQDLSEQKILNALDELQKHNIKITNLIIDDNWQSLNKVSDDVQTDANGKVDQADLGWSDFEANPEGFPKGLKHTATTIRDQFPNIQHIAVWHAILGYWGAIDPKGSIAQRYKTKTISRTFDRKMTVIAKEDIDRMYDDFYRFLLASGIDSVKTDAQFMLDEIADAQDRLDLINSTQDAWTIAALRYFSIKAISCMSQFPDAIFHNQLPTAKPCYMVRNSDDFFPDIQSSHPWHIFINAHNSLFTSYLNIIPDWDMFQTDHEYAGYHAAARCVSGGPVYITDTPGQHNTTLISQMTAQDVRGKTVVLRPSVWAKSTDIYTAYDEQRFLKVGSFWGAKGGVSFLAVFNICEQALLEIVSLRSFPGIEEDQDYLVRGFNTQEVSGAMSLRSGSILSVDLDQKGVEIFSAVPLHSMRLGQSGGAAIKVAVLGLLDKMTGAAALVDQKLSTHQGERVDLQIDLKALGKLGVYVSNLSDLNLEQDFLILLKGDAVPLAFVSIDEQHGILEIDIERAWQAMKLEPGWGNDITVQVAIRV